MSARDEPEPNNLNQHQGPWGLARGLVIAGTDAAILLWDIEIPLSGDSRGIVTAIS
jgi:hypothetical protein